MAATAKTKRPHAPPADAPPWEMPPGTHPARAEAFATYRDQGPERSIDAVAREVHKNRTLIGKWSGQDDWVRRASAWDAELDRRRREAFAAEAEDHAIVLAERAGAFQEALLTPVAEVARRIERARADGEDPFEGVPMADLVRLSATAGRAFAQVATVDRLARGLSTDNVAGHDGGPLRHEVEAKSMAEIDAYLLGRDDERAAG